MMTVIPNVLSRPEVQKLRDALDSAAWQDGRNTAGHIAARAKANQQLAQDDPHAQQMSDFILDRLGMVPQFIAAALPLKVMPPRFNKYVGHGAYGDHIDNAIFAVPGTPVRIRGDLSATLFLSDPEEYDGGALLVRGELGQQVVKLPAGQMILYPASTIHQVTPVTRGARVAAFFWIQSLVREDNRRAMLLDLDETIRGIAGEQPDHASLVRLTGLYHNLLRDWSST